MNSAQYETVVEALTLHLADDDQIRFYKGQRDKAALQEDALRSLGRVVSPTFDALGNGVRVYGQLIKLGWTPPESLR